MTESVATVHRFVAEALLTQILALSREIPGVRANEDIECLHRMRVASRRLRTVLGLFPECLPGRRGEVWLRQTRRVTKALGDARDADVQIAYIEAFIATTDDERAKPGLARLVLRLQQRRGRLQHRVERTLDELEKQGTLGSMEETFRLLRVQAPAADTVPTALFRKAETAVSACLSSLVSYEIYLNDITRVTELHAMRIIAKRLRYTLNVFAPFFPDGLRKPLKAAHAMQDLLGEIHDCDVWLAWLPEFLEEERELGLNYAGHTRMMTRLRPGVMRLFEDRQQARAACHAQFLDCWKETQADGLWDELRQTLAMMPVPSAMDIES
jgi:CHAD domain-containing protein